MRKLFSLFLALVATTSLWAHDFEVDGIYYNYLDGNNVEVTYRGDDYDSYRNEYAGEVIIPSTVRYNGTTYSVTSIGDEAFYYCSSLTSITIGNSVTSIGDYAFYHCSSLTIPVYNAHCFAYMPTSFEGAYVIPEGIKQIAGGAFYDCRSLASVTIPNSVTSIGYEAFYRCISLTSVTIPNSVTSIGEYAFRLCTSLTSVTIPNSVTSIGSGVFAWCQSLTSVTIPNSVTSIGNLAFYHCSSLTSITIPNSVTTIERDAFSGCSSLTSVTIGNSVTSIEDRAFYYCRSLTSITIPNSVTSIGGRAFSGCSSLTSITIGNSVTSIGKQAFDDCSSLTSIICLGTTPPDASDLGANTSTCKLIVPHSAYNAYVRHAYWGQFLNIVPSSEIESSAPEVYINPANPAQKLLRNGQVYILKDDNTYTIMGAQIQ